MESTNEADQGHKAKPCFCPFCDVEIVGSDPFCQACQVTILYCSFCEEPRRGDLKECPVCGQKMEPYRGRDI